MAQARLLQKEPVSGGKGKHGSISPPVRRHVRALVFALFILAARQALRSNQTPLAFTRAVPVLGRSASLPPHVWKTQHVTLGNRHIIEESIDLGSHEEHVAGQHQARQRRLRLLRGLATPAEVKAILRLAASAGFATRETRANPVVTPVQVLAESGVWKPDSLSQAVENLVERRLLPYMRMELVCPSLIVSQVLVRRYVPEQRRAHKMHFDHNAMGTAVFDLVPREGSGLFVGSGAHAATHFFVPYSAPGDVAVHLWDVPHGVLVQANHPRVSLIVWAKPRADVEQDTTSWYLEDAKNGNPDALYRMGLAAQEEGDQEHAIEHHQGAAERGHVFAMRSLHGLLKDRGDLRLATHWLERSATAGFAAAQVDLADSLQWEGQFRDAVSYYGAAAAQNDGRALQRLGAAYLHGLGVNEDSARGLGLLRQSAELGWSDAQYVLATHPSVPAAEAAVLLQAAADQGHPGALFAHALAHNQAGNLEESMRLLEEAAAAGHPQALKEVLIARAADPE